MNQSSKQSKLTIVQKSIDEIELAVTLSLPDFLAFEAANLETPDTVEDLNSILLMIEEISHFRLLVNRANYNQQVSKLQLEFQAELDKIFITKYIYYLF